MTAGHTPTASIAALYNNTTPGTTADPAALDNAIADIVQTIDDNYDFAAGLISAGTLSRLGIINVKDYGASGSDTTTTTGNLASGSQVLVVASTDTFEVGHGVSVAGAGEAGADLVTSITSIVGTNVFLADEASTTVSGATVSHDDTEAIQSAIDSLTNGGTVYFPKGDYILNSAITIDQAKVNLIGSLNNAKLVAGVTSGKQIYVNNNQFSIRNFIVQSSVTANCFDVTAENVVFSNIQFIDCGICIQLETADTILIEKCTFEHSMYGVLQNYGFVSSNVTVRGCTGTNIVGDMIEANCGATGASYNWIITENICNGSSGYDTIVNESITTLDMRSVSEQRFVGITGVTNVTITNNLVREIANCAVNLEDVGGKVIISGNEFTSCNSLAYIIMQSGFDAMHHDAVIDGNIFVNEVETSNTKFIYRSAPSLDADGHGKMVISNNLFFGFEALDAPLFIGGLDGVIISNNEFINLGTIIKYFGSTFETNESNTYTSFNFFNNYFECVKFIDLDLTTGTTNGSLITSKFIGNTIVTSDDTSIKLKADDGVKQIYNLIFSENTINGIVDITNCANISITDNYLGVEMDLGVDDFWSGMFVVKDNFVGAGTLNSKLGWSAYNQEAMGTTAQRPSIHFKGQRYFDTDLYALIFWGGSAWKIEKSGTATILAAGTSIVVTHGLGTTPISVNCTPHGNVGNVWVTAIGATTFTINCSSAPGSNTVVSWIANT